MTQTETIVWHDYIKEKPTEDRMTDWFLLRTTEYDTAQQALLLTYEMWMIHGEDAIDESTILEWAEMPRGVSDDN